MQQSGGLLLAAGFDGGNSFIFVPQGTKMQIESYIVHQQKSPFCKVN